MAASPKKKPLFSLEERAELVRRATSHLPNVRVEPFDELLVDLAAKLDATVVIKGLRAITDFDVRVSNDRAQLPAEPGAGDVVHHVAAAVHVSVVVYRARDREPARRVAQFVPACVNEALLKKFGDA